MQPQAIESGHTYDYIHIVTNPRDYIKLYIEYYYTISASGSSWNTRKRCVKSHLKWGPRFWHPTQAQGPVLSCTVLSDPSSLSVLQISYKLGHNYIPLHRVIARTKQVNPCKALCLAPGMQQGMGKWQPFLFLLLLTATAAGVRNAEWPCLAPNVNFMTLGYRERAERGAQGSMCFSPIMSYHSID